MTKYRVSSSWSPKNFVILEADSINEAYTEGQRLLKVEWVRVEEVK